MYDVNYFIDKFSKIPEENILTAQYGNSKMGCAMGLCSNNLGEHNALYQLGIKFFEPTRDATPIITINNGCHPEYPQPTPKQRILAALYYIRDLQQQDSAVIEVNKILEQKVKECDASKVLI